MRFIHPFSMMSILLACLSTKAAEPEQDVYLLIHPKCSLDPKEVEKEHFTPKQKGQWYPVSYPIKVMKPHVLIGADIKNDVPHKNHCYIVELPPTKATSTQNRINGKLDGENVFKRIPYTIVTVEQSYKLWYWDAQADAPVLLGQGIVSEYASQLQSIAAEKYKILADKPADLTRQATLKAHEEIAQNMANAFADRLMVKKPIKGTDSLILAKGALQNRPRPEFVPSKVFADQGETVIEVELHNRLPVRVACALTRHLKPAERGAYDALPLEQRRRIVIPAMVIHLNLEAGEKATARFRIPAFPDGVKLANESTITAHAVLNPK